jgi:hypothetical protein
MAANERKILRCTIYTRKSSEHGLEQEFNSLDAQREAAEAYIKSQAHEGCRCPRTHYEMEACPAERWHARPCNPPTSGHARSSWWSTRSTA